MAGATIEHIVSEKTLLIVLVNITLSVSRVAVPLIICPIILHNIPESLIHQIIRIVVDRIQNTGHEIFPDTRRRSKNRSSMRLNHDQIEGLSDTPRLNTSKVFVINALIRNIMARQSTCELNIRKREPAPTTLKRANKTAGKRNTTR